MQPQRIELRDRGVSVPADHVLFTFGDGRFDYDCVSCGSQCCRGHGYELNPGGEFQGQIAINAFSRFFIDPRNGLPVVRNLPPGCFFLSADGACEIHRERGYEEKPETCRQFPFNAYALAGDYLLVAPHSGLCPLRVEPTRRSPLSRHSALLEELCTHGIGTEVKRVRGTIDDIDRLVALERRVIEAAEHSLNEGTPFGAFVDQQAALARDLDVDVSGGVSAPSDELREVVSEVLGVDAELCGGFDPDLNALLVAISPRLRSTLVFDDGENVEFPVRLGMVPNYLFAVGVVARLAQMAGMANVTYQTLMRIAMQSRPLVWLLAHLTQRMEWPRGRRIDLMSSGAELEFRAQYLKLMRALARNGGSHGGHSLGQLLLRFNEWEGPAQVAFLRLVSKRCIGRLVVSGTRGSDRRPSPGPLLQRFALHNVPEEMIDTVCDRARSRGNN